MVQLRHGLVPTVLRKQQDYQQVRSVYVWQSIRDSCLSCLDDATGYYILMNTAVSQWNRKKVVEESRPKGLKMLLSLLLFS